MFHHSHRPGGATSVPCPSAALCSCTPTGSLTGAGAPSVGLHDAKFNLHRSVDDFHRGPALQLGHSIDLEKRFRERSYSDLGRCPCSRGVACVGGSSPVSWSRYKTELCRPFQENGACKYGDRCQFAHGAPELRGLSRHPKYKTAPCRTFHTAGFCPYGPRCHFIHNAEERRGPLPLSASSRTQRPRLQHSFSFAGFPSSGPQERPTSVTPPPVLYAADQAEEWQSPLADSRRDFSGLFGPSLWLSPVCEPQGLTPGSTNSPRTPRLSV